MLARGSADDRYAAAIAEASNLLRKQLSDDKVYEAANAFALKLCNEARRYDWSRRKDEFEKGWVGASAAARKLAKHLRLGGFFAEARISAAEKKSGVRLNLNAKERDEALAEFLKAFSEQQRPSSAGGRRLIYGPILISFSGRKRRIRLPAPPEAVAIALQHGFREITARFADRRPIFADKQPIMVERFDHLNTRVGKPCWSAAVAFASAVFNEKTIKAADKFKAANEFEAAVKKQAAAKKLEAAAKQWLENHRGGIRYQGFDE